MDIIKEEIQRQKSYRIAKQMGWYVTSDIIMGTWIYNDQSERVYRVPFTMVSSWRECKRLLKGIEDINELEYFIPNFYNIENIEITWLVIRWASYQHSEELLNEFVGKGYPIYRLSIAVFIEKMLDRIIELEKI